MKYGLSIFLLLILSGLLLSCSDAGYYWQSVSGHLSVMAQRQSIETIIADPATPESLRAKLELVHEVRAFAEQTLMLPVDQSFTTYADIKRPYAVWNVVAAPPYSLVAREWCFPIAGCLPYRGYFAEAEAEQFAGSLRAQGLDVYTYGVTAYSTLGWFDDPVLNTFITYPEWALAGLLFHELAHQVAYADNDGDFNEAFASTVEIEGVRRWLQARQSAVESEAWRQHKLRADAFLELIASTRVELLDCYDGRRDLSVETRQSCKDESFAAMTQRYQGLKRIWGGYNGYDRWFEAGLNNARFISAYTYRHYVPAFMQLLHQHHGDLDAFYQAVSTLAALPDDERHQAMRLLEQASSAANSDTSEPSAPPVKTQSPKS